MAPISGCAPVSTLYMQRSEDLVRLLRRSSSLSKCGANTEDQVIMSEQEDEEGCKTPRSKEHRLVPEEWPVCPPAPKKPHVQVHNRHLPPAAGYFISPELELFFKQLEINAQY